MISLQLNAAFCVIPACPESKFDWILACAGVTGGVNVTT